MFRALYWKELRASWPFALVALLAQGILCAIAGGYDYVAHVEGDLLTRLDVSTICRLMQDRRIDALGTVAPGFGWLETGLLFFRVDYLRQSRLVERYDWQRRFLLGRWICRLAAACGTYRRA